VKTKNTNILVKIGIFNKKKGKKKIEKGLDIFYQKLNLKKEDLFKSTNGSRKSSNLTFLFFF
jgi:hypothetical protein